eukprot:CAMPEP_0114665328 /NCGR_PEP_ID=MMETSP0191-20121206/30550_1 /TAXON_ID=126664 /ORGANISM="Sorites sp." /LENGTH=151 /DNA_ID=CAMNT_0001910065 /DNA_START=80 /DNA_END=532 /DNA_ORIENTATION=+
MSQVKVETEGQAGGGTKIALVEQTAVIEAKVETMTEAGVETGTTGEVAQEGMAGHETTTAEIAAQEEATVGPGTMTEAAEGHVIVTGAGIGVIVGMIVTEVLGGPLGQEEGPAETGEEIGFAKSATATILPEEIPVSSAMPRNQQTDGELR